MTQIFACVIFLLYLCSRKGLNNLSLALTALKSKDKRKCALHDYLLAFALLRILSNLDTLNLYSEIMRMFARKCELSAFWIERESKPERTNNQEFALFVVEKIKIIPI